MKDNVKDIVERLNEAEENQRARREILRESLDTCQRLEKEYEEALRTETDPDKYNELITKATENKNRYTALLRQRNQKEAPALSHQEFEEIRKDINAEIKATQEQHAPAIIEALKTLIPLVNAYSEDLEVLEGIQKRADWLTGNVGRISVSIDPSAIKDYAPEELADVLTAFMHGYHINQGTFRTYKGNVRP